MCADACWMIDPVHGMDMICWEKRHSFAVAERDHPQHFFWMSVCPMLFAWNGCALCRVYPGSG